MHRQLEETVHSQRCRLLALQSHLQCALESAQTALPVFRSELDNIRQLTTDWKQCASKALADLRTNVLEQTTALLGSIEADWLDRLEEERDRSHQLDKERERLAEELRVARQEINEWKERLVAWEEEKKDLITSAQSVLRQREKEMEQTREESLESQKMVHQREMEDIQQKLRALVEEREALIQEWRSASDQVN